MATEVEHPTPKTAAADIAAAAVARKKAEEASAVDLEATAQRAEAVEAPSTP